MRLDVLHQSDLLRIGECAQLGGGGRTVEQLPWLLNWDLLAIDGKDYPNAAFTLRLNTLSLDKEWIGV